MKLTAQFVARNGRQFLTTVMQREQRNYLFDFLRPQHSLFNYFTKLVEQYTKVVKSVFMDGTLLEKFKRLLLGLVLILRDYWSVLHVMKTLGQW